MDNSTNKQILITGGSGFIGSHAALCLQDGGFEPIVLDLNTNRNSKKVLESKKIPIFEGNINDKKIVDEIYSKYPFKSVMHFAAFIEAGESVTNPKKFYDNNVENFKNFLANIKEFNIQNFVFSSSAAIYGTYEKPIEEDFEKKPESPYGETKWKGEEILAEFAKENGVRATSLRYFNAAGAHPDGNLGEDHEPETHLIPKIIQAILEKKPLSVFGSDYPTPDGTCVRDYIHVIDLARGHLMALEHAIKSMKAGEHEYFNLGSGNGYSILEVIKSLEGVVGHPIEKKMADRRAGDPPRLVASVSKIKEKLGFVPEHNLDSILKSAWSYFSKKKQ